MPTCRIVRSSTLLAILAAAILFSATLFAQPGAYVSFDAPGAGTGQNEGTFPSSINRQGWIGGTIVLATGLQQGFLRSPNGSFTSVLQPGATQSTVSAINASHEAAGVSSYSNGSSFAFVRDASGNYTQLAPSGAVTSAATGMNDKGVVVGYEYDSTLWRGFLRSKEHGFTVFDAPGATSATYAYAINNAGEVAGYYVDSSFNSHGFFRSASGHFITFQEFQGAASTNALAMNSVRQMTGYAGDGDGGTYGFVRNATGNSEIFTVVGAQATQGSAINDSGVTVGWETIGVGSYAALERDPSGAVSLISLPFSNTGSIATGINALGLVTGNYIDANGAAHGWAGVP